MDSEVPTAKEPPKAHLGVFGFESDLGPIRWSKEFLSIKNGLLVPLKSNKLHVVVALSRHRRFRRDLRSNLLLPARTVFGTSTES
jgi:hypothetical protein